MFPLSMRQLSSSHWALSGGLLCFPSEPLALGLRSKRNRWPSFSKPACFIIDSELKRDYPISRLVSKPA